MLTAKFESLELQKTEMRHRLTKLSISSYSFWFYFFLHFSLLAKGTEPLHDWTFSQEKISAQTISAVAGKLKGTFERRSETSAFGIRFDGSTSMDVPGMTPDQLPDERITADAWVSLDAGTRWGSIVGFYQDNGSYEKGWLLGYNDSHFVFSVSTASKLHTITSKTAFEKGKWYHVAGSFDGKSMKLYVNGVEESAGNAASGKIAYPEKAYYTIGAYRDQDEFFRMKGTIHRIRLYGDALTAAEIRSLHAKGKSVFPKGVTYTVKPHLRFDSPRSATVYWETDEPGHAILQYGQEETLNLEVKGKTQTRNHSMTLDGLEPGESYHYRITMVAQSGVEMMGETYELDMRMNFAVPGHAWEDG